MKLHLETYRKIYGAVGFVVALVIAGVYLWAVPQEASEVSGFAKAVLVYGHSACWIFLSVASVLWAVKHYVWSTRLAYVALVTYLVFIGTLITTAYL